MHTWIIGTNQTSAPRLKLLNKIKSWLRSVNYTIQLDITTENLFLLAIEYNYTSHNHIPKRKAYNETPITIDGILYNEELGFYNKKNLNCIQIEEMLLATPELMLNTARGDFSLAFFDKTGQLIHTATDIYGTKPIYYFHKTGKACFASNDLRALLLIDEIPCDIDFDICKMYPTSSFAIGENDMVQQTFFKGIYKLPPASILKANNFTMSIIPYWEPPKYPLQSMDESVAIDLLKDSLNTATDIRLNKEGITMITLSGGLDSANILAAANPLNNQVFALSLVFKEADMIFSHDEPLVKKIIHDLHIPGAIVYGDNILRIPNILPGRDSLFYIDGPDPRANPPILDIFAAIANSMDTERILTGDGGDYIAGVEKCIFDSLIKQKKLATAFSILWNWSKNIPNFIKYTTQYAIAPFIPLLGNYLYCKLFWKVPITAYPYFFTKEQTSLEKQLYKNLGNNLNTSRSWGTWGHRYIKDFLWPRGRYLDACNTNSDTMHPFYDRAILELVFQIPPEHHFDFRRIEEGNYYASKMLLRKAYKDLLPDYILNKKVKTSYALMARKSLLYDKEALIDEFLIKEKLHIADLDIINKKHFSQYLTALLIKLGDPNYTLGIEYRYAKATIDLEIWLKEATQGRDYLLNRSRPIPLTLGNLKADIEYIHGT